MMIGTRDVGGSPVTSGRGLGSLLLVPQAPSVAAGAVRRSRAARA